MTPMANCMARFSSPMAYLSHPPNFPSCNLNFVSQKLKYLSLLKNCSSLKELTQIHAQIQASGLHGDGYLMSEVVRFCALSPFGNLECAQNLLYQMLHPIPSSWNHVIRGYSCSRSPREAILVYLVMRSRGKKPTKLTFPFLLKACATLPAFEEGRQIQVEIVKHGFDSDVIVQNTLIHFYGSCRKIFDACQVFDFMPFRTVVTWNSIITACVENSLLDDSIMLFDQMRLSGIEPDEATMVILLSACAELGNLSLGKWIHSYVMEKGLMINCRLGTALVDMYAKCGVMDCARVAFERMLERNVWTWSAMILGFAQHGLAKESLKLFEEMKNCSIQPNYVTFLGILCACSHAGLVDKGYEFFHEMQHVHCIKPMMTHYGAMVDVIARSGHLEEAYYFIKSMPMEADPVVWRTLLSACNIHDVNGSSWVGTKVRERLLEMEPKRIGNLVMVANMYAEVGMWEEAAAVRKAMRHGGLKKMPGESCIELDGSIHRFLSGDDTHVDSDCLYQMLNGLYLHMKLINSEI